MSPVPWQSPEAIANAFVKEAFEKNLYFTKHEKWNAVIRGDEGIHQTNDLELLTLHFAL